MARVIFSSADVEGLKAQLHDRRNIAVQKALSEASGRIIAELRQSFMHSMAMYNTSRPEATVAHLENVKGIAGSSPAAADTPGITRAKR